MVPEVRWCYFQDSLTIQVSLHVCLRTDRTVVSYLPLNYTCCDFIAFLHEKSLGDDDGIR